MTAALATPQTLRVQFRDSEPTDLPYVLNSWQHNWRESAKCRRLKGGQFSAYFDDIVRNGLFREDDTKILIAAAENDADWIWAWLCYTPGIVPTLHYAVVRRDIPARPVPLQLRGNGILTRLVAAAGVTRECVYTFLPNKAGDEAALLGAAQRAGITAVFRDVEEFLEMRRGR